MSYESAAAEPDLHDRVTARLGGDGLRYTAGRRTIVGVLAGAGEPRTLPQILASATSLTQSSAYRNLAELEGAGVVRRIVTGDDHSHFELAEDLTGHHHHHLVCTDCGSVTDFPVDDGLEGAIEMTAARVGERSRFVVDHHRLDLIGTCIDCQTAGSGDH